MTDIKNEKSFIKITFFTKTRLIGQMTYNNDMTLRGILDFFNNNFHSTNVKAKNEYKIEGKEIDKSKFLSDLFYLDEYKEIVELELWIEMDEIFFMDETNIKMEKIFYPKLYPFGIYSYELSNNKIINIPFDNDITIENNLINFNKNSAYCNTQDSLYLSGGSIFSKPIIDFWIINKNNYNITKMKMPIPKKNHSMLYIPDNFIFISGGNSPETMFFDIELKKFIKWAKMNNTYKKPLLFNFGDYIYAFDSNNKNINYFERTNICSKIPRWEKIYPNFDNKISNFFNHYFRVPNLSDRNIFFYGDNKTHYSKKNLYNPINNSFYIPFFISKDIITSREVSSINYKDINKQTNLNIDKELFPYNQKKLGDKNERELKERNISFEKLILNSKNHDINQFISKESENNNKLIIYKKITNLDKLISKRVNKEKILTLNPEKLNEKIVFDYSSFNIENLKEKEEYLNPQYKRRSTKKRGGYLYVDKSIINEILIERKILIYN